MPKFCRSRANAALFMQEQLLCDIDKAARLLFIDVPTLQRWISEGIIRAVRKGRKQLIPRAEIVRQLANKLIVEDLRALIGHKSAHTTVLLYCRRDAAAMLDISLRALDYLLASKRLKRRRIGRKVLIHHRDLERFSASDQLRALRPPPPDESERSTKSPTTSPILDGDNSVDEESNNG